MVYGVTPGLLGRWSQPTGGGVGSELVNHLQAGPFDGGLPLMGRKLGGQFLSLVGKDHGPG